tara:strand:+ start:614 stop:1489 length:876 start_codon:yes stop_codon:yes gene_type:complete
MKAFSFIINPVSGHGAQKIERDISTFLHSQKNLDGEIHFTKAPGDATLRTKTALQNGLIPVAVGGDGTVNEVAKCLINTGKSMGIIPHGSGNGIARHLHIPLNAKQALLNLVLGRETLIDTGLVNDIPFVMLVGLGFDAQIAYKMSLSTTRGLKTYAKLVLKEWRNFKPVHLDFTLDGNVHSRDGFMFSFANAAQFGNNFYIAPKASMQDGLLNIAVLKPFPLTAALSIAWRMATKSIHHSNYMEQFEAKEVYIAAPQKRINLDGEVVNINAPLHIKIQPHSLQIICPQQN